MRNPFRKNQPENKVITPKVNVYKFPEQDSLVTSSITPVAINSAQYFAENGEMRQLLNLLDLLEQQDDNLAGDLDVRKEAAKVAKFKLPEGLSKQQEEFFTHFLKKHLPTLIEQTIDLKMKGIIFSQIIYSFDGLYRVEKYLTHKNHDIRVKNEEPKLFIDGELFVYPELNFVLSYRKNPILAPLLKYYAFFMFAINNWASFIEIFGKPIRVGKYQPGTSQKEKDQLWEMIQSVGTDLAAMISQQTAIEFVEHKNSSASSSLYKDLLTFVSERVTKRILGQVLTTTSQATGTYAQAKVHELVRQDILLGDLRDAENHISKQCSLLNKINFADEEISIELYIQEIVNLAQLILIDKELNNIIEIDPEYFYKTYNKPEPKGGYKKKEVASSPFPFQNKASKPFSRQKNSQIRMVLNAQNSKLWKKLEKLMEQSEAEISKKSAKIKEKLDSFESISNLTEEDFKELTDEYSLQLQNMIEFSMKSSYLNKTRQAKSLLTGSILAEIDWEKKLEKLFEIDWNLESEEALEAFKKEAMKVAGIQTKEVRLMLQEKAEKAFTEGSTFEDWREEIKIAGFEADNPYYLRTNFNTAVNGAYMAGAWARFEEDKDIFPYLQYQTVNDENVRESHQAMNGIIRKVDDSFWDTNLPPNDWNCRCEVVPLMDFEAEKDPNFEKPLPFINTSPDFQFNSLKDKTLWGDWLKNQ